MITLILFSGFKNFFVGYITWVMILHGIEYQHPTSLNMRILADHVTYSFLAFMKSIFHFCLGCYCGGYSQNRRSNLSSWCSTSDFAINCTWSLIAVLIHIDTYSLWLQKKIIYQTAFRFQEFNQVMLPVICCESSMVCWCYWSSSMISEIYFSIFEMPKWSLQCMQVNSLRPSDAYMRR